MEWPPALTVWPLGPSPQGFLMCLRHLSLAYRQQPQMGKCDLEYYLAAVSKCHVKLQRRFRKIELQSTTQ